MDYRNQFRRPKQDPCADFWHTVRLGLVVFVVLLIVLPRVL